MALRPESLLEVRCGRSRSRAYDGSCSERRRRRSGKFALVIVALSFSCRRRTSESADVANFVVVAGTYRYNIHHRRHRHDTSSRPVPSLFRPTKTCFPCRTRRHRRSASMPSCVAPRTRPEAGLPGYRCHHHLHHHPPPSITSVPFGSIGPSFQLLERACMCWGASRGEEVPRRCVLVRVGDSARRTSLHGLSSPARS